jgi:predicted nucleic acid-binding protein
MIIVDTSIWVDHLRAEDPRLTSLLTRRLVSMHPWIVGELACGMLPKRADVLRNLQRLPTIPVARDQEVLFFIERHHLMGSGIGWVDAQILAAALAAGVSLWTRDRRLLAAAAPLGVLHSPVVT